MRWSSLFLTKEKTGLREVNDMLSVTGCICDKTMQILYSIPCCLWNNCKVTSKVCNEIQQTSILCTITLNMNLILLKVKNIGIQIACIRIVLTANDEYTPK